VTVGRDLHLAVALNDAGWHPAAWRAPQARGAELFDAGYWGDLAHEAERGQLDFVTMEDSSVLQSARPGIPDGRADQVRGRLDTLLVTTAMAARTSRLGLVPTITTRTDPYRLSTGIATLDHLSGGRAGWRPIAAHRGAAGPMPGHRDAPPPRFRGPADPAVASYLRRSFEAGAAVVELVRALWDSWDDGAILHDVGAGRFLDPARVRPVDAVHGSFSVDGPSATPRPRWGHPVVLALTHTPYSDDFALRVADVVVVTPGETDLVPAVIAGLRGREAAFGRPSPPKVYADLVVFLGDTEAAARERKARLDELDGAEFSSDAFVFTGTPSGLADLLLSWRELGVEGFRLRPGTLPADLTAVIGGLVPELRARGAFRTGYPAGSLRARLGLPAPPAVASPAVSERVEPEAVA